ncbi:hypothetical protein V6N13_080273 [Hibiscus sabdariffa]
MGFKFNASEDEVVKRLEELEDDEMLHRCRLVIESDSVLALSWIVGNKPCPAFLAEKRFAQLLWIAEHKAGKVG